MRAPEVESEGELRADPCGGWKSIDAIGVKGEERGTCFQNVCVQGDDKKKTTRTAEKVR